MSSEGQDREPRLNDDVLNSVILLMINATILMIMMMYACAFSHRIPLKHKGCLSCGAYRQQLRLTLSGTGFGSFFQSSHKGQVFFSTNYLSFLPTPALASIALLITRLVTFSTVLI